MSSSMSFTDEGVYGSQESNSVIVIPAMEMTVDLGTFTCSGSGLRHDGYKFDADVDRFMPPLPSEAGRAKIEEQPLAYWRAQCAFRNLMQKETMEDLEVEDLQCRLRERKGAMDVHLAKVEKDLNEEFWRQNAAVRKAMWNALGDNNKAGANPERLLREIFQNGGDNDIVTLQLCKSDRLQIYRAAFGLGLCVESANVPLKSDGARSGFDKFTVIGRRESAVRDETQRLSREAIRSRQRVLDAQEEKTRSLHETVVGEVRKAIESSPNDVSWDVCGLWAISCPSIEDTLDRLDYRCSLDIRFAQRSSTEGMLWAKFNFTTIKGVSWFRKSNPYSGDSDFDDDDSYEYFDQDGLNQPCPDHPDWDFRWRGEEISDGKVLHSQQNPGYIEFSGVGGTDLSGVLSFNDNRKSIDFTGRKIGPSPPFPTVEYRLFQCEWDRVGN